MGGVKTSLSLPTEGVKTSLSLPTGGVKTPTQARRIGVMLRLLDQTQQGTGRFLGIYTLQWCI